jgi:hypothetical protein
VDRAPLRPVPDRPSEPVSDAAAVARVTAALPALSERERVALALAAVAAAPRGQVALRLGIDEQELSEVLARARKQLRRTVAPLPGSGWCERAERLISDRLDGVLADSDAGRLEVHLRNCPRCVEHERRLVQATDALVSGLAPTGPQPPHETAPADAPPLTEAPPAEDAPPAEPAPPAEEAPAAAAASAASASPEPGSSEVAAAAEVLVGVRTRRQIAAAFTRNVVVVLAVLLALATIAFTIAAILGAEL